MLVTGSLSCLVEWQTVKLQGRSCPVYYMTKYDIKNDGVRDTDNKHDSIKWGAASILIFYFLLKCMEICKIYDFGLYVLFRQ
jgi:hypothetical protein